MSMSISRFSRVISGLGLGVLAIVTTVPEAAAGMQFAAEMVSRDPQGQVTRGKMYVGEGRMRTEMPHQGRELVRITDRTAGKEWVVFPGEQTYIEHALPAGMADAAAAATTVPPAEVDPCRGIDSVNCRRVGEESVAGRAAVKWEMSVNRDGQTLTGTQWIDVERGLPLKYQMPDGRAMELQMVGIEALDGRQVEKWEMTTQAPGQQTNRTFQWYDPELKLSVREELPGGFVRELDNIQVGPQPDTLFQVPEGFKRVEPPAPPR